MLDTTANTPALLPQQAAAPAYEWGQAPSGCRRWHIVATKPKAERIAHAALHHRGYGPYLPLLLGKPLFAGYCFLQLGTAQPWYPLAWCPGVYSLLQCQGKPSVVPDAVLDALRAGEELRSIPTTPQTLYRPGAACEAVLGGGSKVEAVVMAIDGRKARVLALMFGQMREMTVDIANLRLRNE